MKHLTFLFLFLLILVLFTTCKKDRDHDIFPSAVIAGTYEGKYGTGSNTPSVFYSFKINTNGILEELDESGSKIGDGIWSINNNTFRTSYNSNFPANSFYSAVGQYDAISKHISGTWGYGTSETNGGKWYMIRK